MKVTNWGILREGAVVRISFDLPCGHEILVTPESLDTDGRFSGRLGCPAPCRRVYDDVVIVGYSTEEASKRG